MKLKLNKNAFCTKLQEENKIVDYVFSILLRYPFLVLFFIENTYYLSLQNMSTIHETIAK